MQITKIIITLNGIYDILCGLCIIKFIEIPILKDLHLSMIKHNYHISKNEVNFLAGWVFVNGIIRISSNYLLISYSYFFEAIIFSIALMMDYVKKDKTIFVIITSLFLCVKSYLLVQ